MGSARRGELVLAFRQNDLFLRIASHYKRYPKEVRANGTLASAREMRALSFPEKFCRTINFRRQTFVHGTVEAGLFENFSMR